MRKHHFKEENMMLWIIYIEYIYIYVYIYIYIYRKQKEKKHLFCSPCYTRRDNLSCQQVEKTNVFQSYKTGKRYKIFHQLTCKSQAIIYLLQCRICFIQYVGKSETTFNLRSSKGYQEKRCNLSLHTFPKVESYTSTRCKIRSYCTDNEEIYYHWRT